jgi:molybdopterin-guanine dinucleotide biosynthesis protein
MTQLIWITGRAATGKTTLIRELVARLTEDGKLTATPTHHVIRLPEPLPQKQASRALSTLAR